MSRRDRRIEKQFGGRATGEAPPPGGLDGESEFENINTDENVADDDRPPVPDGPPVLATEFVRQAATTFDVDYMLQEPEEVAFLEAMRASEGDVLYLSNGDVRVLCRLRIVGRNAAGEILGAVARAIPDTMRDEDPNVPSTHGMPPAPRWQDVRG